MDKAGNQEEHEQDGARKCLGGDISETVQTMVCVLYNNRNYHQYPITVQSDRFLICFNEKTSK